MSASVKLKLLHVSDIHLGAKFGFLSEKSHAHRERLWQSLEKVAEEAIKLSVQAVLFTGDIFDNSFPAEASIKRLNLILEKLAERQIYSIILPGNHDKFETNSVWANWKNEGPLGHYIKIFGQKEGVKQDLSAQKLSLDIAGQKVDFYGEAVQTQKSSQSPLKAVLELLRDGSEETMKIVLAHGAMSIGAADGAARGQISQAELQELSNLGVRYLALGDWHGSKDVSPLNAQKFRAFYAGCLEIVASDQMGGGNCLYIEISDVETKVKEVRISSLKAERIVFNCDQASLDSLSKELASRASQDLILTIELTGNPSLDMLKTFDQQRVEEEFRTKFYFLRITDSMTINIQKIDSSQYPENSIPKEFIDRVQQALSKGEIDEVLASEIIRVGLNAIGGVVSR